MLGTIFAGFFTLIKFLLTHLEKKNGHLERIADKFNETTKDMAKAVTNIDITLKTNLTNISSLQTKILKKITKKKK